MQQKLDGISSKLGLGLKVEVYSWGADADGRDAACHVSTGKPGNPGKPRKSPKPQNHQ